MAEQRTRAHVLIGGRVQGVGFRESTRMIAEHLGLGGWVRNLLDGRVEATFEGPASNVARAVSWCEDGPSGARVQGVDVRYEEPFGEVDFRIRPSAEARERV